MTGVKNFQELPLLDQLKEKVNIYYRSIWREKWNYNLLDNWLKNFDEAEHVDMLYLLSKFMYFGNSEIRQILSSIYRDLYKYPIIESIRKDHADTTDIKHLNHEFLIESSKTRFLGVGNPSESGVHILYYFRQENKMEKDDFIYVSDMFRGVEKTEHGKTYIALELNNADVTRYVFIDDFCGSGNQAKDYLLNDLRILKKLKPDVEINYFMMFGTAHGIDNLKSLATEDNTAKIFDKVDAIFELDDTFKAFSEDSRFYNTVPSGVSKEMGKEICEKYGRQLVYYHPLGYKDGQMLLSFFHNTPDNALPVFWCSHNNWSPIFKRYNKI